MLRPISFAFMLFALPACSAEDHESQPDTAPPLPAAAAQELQGTLDGVIEADVAPGVAVVVRRPGYAAWSGAAGVADRATRAALAPSQRCRAGSVLKTAVATAVLQLVEQGKLSLDSNATELLPAQIATRIPDAEQVTLRMLLDHTSGIPDFDDGAFDAHVAEDPRHVWALDELLGLAFALPPTARPGETFSYSNTDYVLLGQIIERATGESWRKIVRERVFARAGMRDSSLPEEGNASCDGCSRGYEPIEDELVDITEVDPSMAGPAGGDALITTTEDLAKLLQALTDGQLFDEPGTLDTMLDFVAASVPEEATTGYGLGVARLQVGDTQLFGHLGGAVGFQTFMLFEPNSRTVVSGYMNRRGDFGSFVVPVLEAVARIVAPPPSGASSRDPSEL
ncbi:MAG: serine hydrolase domain-containing protein [Myxococcales bacterium]